MGNTLKTESISNREIYFFRQRQKNFVFQSVLAFFVKRAKSEGITKKQLATRLGKDAAQITRWLSGPSNWTLDTVSDLLLALDAEPKLQINDLQEPTISSFNVNSQVTKSPSPASTNEKMRAQFSPFEANAKV